MKIYVIDEYILEGDYHNTLGIFTELQLAQTVQPTQGIELMIIKEMLLLDSQFLPSGFSCMKEKTEDDDVWSEWVEMNDKAY